jgi:ribosomal protein S18 acetylase RimI-like enzyme
VDITIDITAATDEDAGELLTLQRAAYVSEAQIYGDPHLPPLTETLAELRAALQGGTVALTARAGTRLIAAVRARTAGATCHIGRLAVAPDLQGRGIGSRLMAEVEHRYADRVARFELFTGDRSEANLRLYRRRGYVEFARRPAGTHNLVFLRKGARAPNLSGASD